MKIGVASTDKVTAQHFGHCDGFDIFESDGEKIISSKFIPNPGHKPGFLPRFLNEQGVNVIIAGGMGSGAIEIFEENNIKVITGAQGDPKENAQAYIEGKLVSSNTACKGH